MTESHRKLLEEKLKSYGAFAADHSFDACRLCHYISERCRAMDLGCHEIEDQIRGCLAEGFSVDWAVRDRTLYLRVYEGGPQWQPDWELVFEERDIPLFTKDGRQLGPDEL